MIKNPFSKKLVLSDAVKASIAYTIASLFTKGLSVLSTPIFTRIMSTEQIGVVTTFTSWNTIISVFATLALTSGSLNVAMMEYPKRRDEYLSSIFGLSLLSSIFCIAIYLPFISFWNDLFGLTTSQMLAMLLSFLVVPCTNYWICKQRYEYKFRSVLVITLIQSLLTFGTSVLTVIIAKNLGFKNLGEIRTVAMNIVPVLFGLAFASLIIIRGKKLFDKYFWLFSLKINLPLMVHTLAKHIFDVSDRLMIDKLRGKSEAGIYGTLYSISSISLIVWNAINASLIPTFFEKIKAHRERELERVITAILIVYAVFAFGITLFAPEIIRILATSEYYNAVYMMPPVAAGIYLTSLYNIYSNVLLYSKKTWMIMTSTIVSALANIALNYWLIPIYGYIAAAYTTIASYIILTILIIIFTKIVFKRRFCNDKLIIVISIISIGLMLLCNILYNHTIIRFSVAGVLIVLCIVFRKKIINTLKFITRKNQLKPKET